MTTTNDVPAGTRLSHPDHGVGIALSRYSSHRHGERVDVLTIVAGAETVLYAELLSDWEAMPLRPRRRLKMTEGTSAAE